MSLRPAPASAAACPVAATASRLERVLALGEAHREAATAVKPKPGGAKESVQPKPGGVKKYPGWYQMPKAYLKRFIEKESFLRRLRTARTAQEREQVQKEYDAWLQERKKEEYFASLEKNFYLFADGYHVNDGLGEWSAIRKDLATFNGSTVWQASGKWFPGERPNWARIQWLQALSHESGAEDALDALNVEGWERFELPKGTPQVLKNAKDEIVVVSYDESVPQDERRVYYTFDHSDIAGVKYMYGDGRINYAFEIMALGKVNHGDDGPEIDGRQNWGFNDVIIAWEVWDGLEGHFRNMFLTETLARNIYMMISA